MGRTIRRGGGRRVASRLELGRTETIPSKRRPNPAAVKHLLGQRHPCPWWPSACWKQLEELPCHSLQEKAVGLREEDQQ